MSFLLSITWDVSPEIIGIGPLSIRYYGLLFALGFIFGYQMFKHFLKTENLSIEEADKFSIYVFIGAVLGARLGHVFFYEPAYYLQNPGEILQIWQGGLASHGGTLGILIALWFYSKRNWKKYLWGLDRLSVPTALAGALIRTGNLMNSEIYGRETTLPWGFVFARNGETVPKHPTQIYEALCYLAIFVFLWFMYKKDKANTPKGKIVGWFLILVFGTRFFIEFVKEVQVGFEQDMIINMGQILSIPLIIAGILLVYFSKKQKA